MPAAALALASAAALVATSAGMAAASPTRAATGRAASAVNLADVTLDIGDQAGSGSESLLKAAGLLDKLPFKAHWADFPSGPPMLQAEAAGSVDIGGVGDAPPIFAASGGAKIAVVEALQTDPDAAALLVPKGSNVTSVAGLEGKTIAVAQGSSADYHLLAVLTKAGLTVHDVKLDYLQPAEGLAALTSGQVDAWDVWSPFIEEVVGEDGARVLVNGTAIGHTYSFVVASRSALSNPGKAAAIRAYLTDLNQAYVWEKTHTSAWATTWATATGLPTSIMQKATQDDVSVPHPISTVVLTSEQSVPTLFTPPGSSPTKWTSKISPTPASTTSSPRLISTAIRRPPKMTLTTTPAAVGTLTVHPLSPVIGAKVKGVDLAHVSDAEVAGIRSALLAHKVIFFRDQAINQEEQIAFARRLGDLTGGHPTLPSSAGNGPILELDSLHGGRADHWHTDVTFALEPPAISILRAVTLPDVGGDTQWANTEAAYARLPEPLKRLAGDLHAIHSNAYDYAQPPVGHETEEARQHRSLFTRTVFETEHPVVRLPRVRPPGIAPGRLRPAVGRPAE